MYRYSVSQYSSPCILRPPIQPEKCLKLEVLILRGIYIENIWKVSMMPSLKIEGILTWMGLKSQGSLYFYPLLSTSANLQDKCIKDCISKKSKGVHVKVSVYLIFGSLILSGFAVRYSLIYVLLMRYCHTFNGQGLCVQICTFQWKRLVKF